MSEEPDDLAEVSEENSSDKDEEWNGCAAFIVVILALCAAPYIIGFGIAILFIGLAVAAGISLLAIPMAMIFGM